MRNITKALVAVATLAAVVVGTTACEVPEDNKTTHAEEVVKEQAAAPAREKAKPKPAVEKETPNYTTAQENAIATAIDYLDYTAFSESGLVDQLEFEGYKTEDATFAVNHIDVDWNVQAAAAAKDYLDYDSFSRSGLIDQLEYEGYTTQQATYGVNQTGL